MIMRPPIVQSGETITVYVDGLPETINRDHSNWERVKQAIRDEQWDQLVPLMNIPKGLVQYSEGNITIVDDVFLFRGIEVADYLVTKIMEMFHDKMPIQPMVRYFENLMTNPNPEARKDQFKWLEAGNMPITDDGYVIGYKYVDENYKSCHNGVWELKGGKDWILNTGRYYDHVIGSIVTMPREKCDENSRATCSTGLHFCSFSYLNSGYTKSKRIVLVKINPRDIVAVPADYSFAKARCCEYEVITEIDVQEHGDILAGKRVVRASQKITTLDDLIFSPTPAAVETDAERHDRILEEEEDELYEDQYSLHEDHVDFDRDDDDEDVDDGETETFYHEATDQRFTAAEVLNLLSKYGSQGAVARETCIPRSTFGGWLNKITEDRESSSEVQLSFFHEGTNQTFTAQGVLDLLSAHGSQGAVERNIGIPRSTLRGWLNRIEAANG